MKNEIQLICFINYIIIKRLLLLTTIRKDKDNPPIFKQNRKKIFIFLLVDTFIILSVIVFLRYIYPCFYTPLEINGIYLNTPHEIVDFHLINNHGRPFTKTDLKGHWTLMFFGFTHCEMICPTTLEALNKLYKILEKELPQNNLPHVLFISIDPERDTIERINSYIHSFNTQFLGARTGVKETLALEKQLSVIVSPTTSTINHSAEILLINPAAQVQAYFYYPNQPEKMASDYKLILKTVND